MELRSIRCYTRSFIVGFLLLIQWNISNSNPILTRGCNFYNLCGQDEKCFDDGLFGQCIASNSEPKSFITLQYGLNVQQLKILREAMANLANLGLDWSSIYAQCVIAHLKLVFSFEILYADYDKELCTKFNPTIILPLFQRIEKLIANNMDDANDFEAVEENLALHDGPVIVMDNEDDLFKFFIEKGSFNPIIEMDSEYPNDDANANKLEFENIDEMDNRHDLMTFVKTLKASESQAKNEPNTFPPPKPTNNIDNLIELENDIFSPNMDEELLERILEPMLNSMLLSNSSRYNNKLANNIPTLKKTLELHAPFDESEDVDSPQIAPKEQSENILLFKKDDEHFNSQDMGLSNTIHKIVKGYDDSKTIKLKELLHRINRDPTFSAFLIGISCLTLCVATIIFGIDAIRRRRSRQCLDKTNSDTLKIFYENEKMPEDKKFSSSYVSKFGECGIEIQPNSKNSTSSYSEEMFHQYQKFDLNTGNIVLSFMKNTLSNPEEISKQWQSISQYRSNGETKIANDVVNKDKNFEPKILPYDENVVLLHAANEFEVGGKANAYINASKIYDQSTRNASYILTQVPMENTVADFWLMIWELGIQEIINLCEPHEFLGEKAIYYWPVHGYKQFDIFQVQLVSEFFWSEDFVIRSIYMKNIVTNETRTVTQFHFLKWTKGKAPPIRPILEFRRKVHKSYRGINCAPMLVHSSTGSGRAGVYCVVDIVCNRILNGVKEINIESTLETVRDQRIMAIENEEQYQAVFSCIAEEVSHMLQNSSTA